MQTDPANAKTTFILATMIDVILESIIATDQPLPSKAAIMSIIATSVANEARNKGAKK